MFKLHDNLSLVQILILSALNKQDSETVTDVIEDLSTTLGSNNVLHRGTIYPAIKQLSIRGLVKLSGKRPMYIVITPSGREILPSLSQDIKRYLESYYDLVSYFQETLSIQYEEIHVNFLKDIIRLSEEFISKNKHNLENAQEGISEWKDVEIN